MASSGSDARRSEVLEALLGRNISFKSAAELLAREPWDSDLPLVIVRASHIEGELLRFLNGELNAHDVDDWANFFEVRDDVEFENDTVKEIMFELANPTIEGALTTSSAQSKLTRIYTAIERDGV